MADPRKDGGLAVEIHDGSGVAEPTPGPSSITIENGSGSEAAIIAGALIILPPGGAGYVRPVHPSQGTSVEVVLYEWVGPEPPDPLTPVGGLALPHLEKRLVVSTRLGGGADGLPAGTPGHYRLTSAGLNLL